MTSKQQARFVLITGTSTGIGRATALKLDQLGFHVLAGVRRADDGQALQQQASERLIPVLLDVTDSDSIHRAHDVVAEQVGERGLYGLINNAGIGFGSPMEFIPLDRLRWLYDVNLFGLLEVTQVMLPLLRHARGRIVNVSSVATLVVSPFHGPYSSVKMALNGLSEALRLELRPHGVSVSTIICGVVQTPIWDKGRDVGQQIAQRLPPEAMELYGAEASKMTSHFAKLSRGGVTPEAAAKIMVRPMLARRPKARYRIGWDAWWMTLFSSLVHGTVRDQMVLSSFKMNARFGG